MAAMMDDQDVNLGSKDPNANGVISAAAAVPPGSYVTQMQAVQNPVRFEPANRSPSTEKEVKRDGHPATPPARRLPPHYGMEAEPLCCLCTKLGRFVIVFVAVTIITLVVVYMYWGDIYKKESSEKAAKGSGAARTPNAPALERHCGLELPADIQLTPPKSFLVKGEMDWASICGQEERSITVLRRSRSSKSFWLGMEFVHAVVVAAGGKWHARIDMKISTLNFFAEYPFTVSPTRKCFTMTEVSTNGNLRDQLRKLSNDELSTVVFFDRQSAEASTSIDDNDNEPWKDIEKFFQNKQRKRRETFFEDTVALRRSIRRSNDTEGNSTETESPTFDLEEREENFDDESEEDGTGSGDVAKEEASLGINKTAAAFAKEQNGTSNMSTSSENGEDAEEEVDIRASLVECLSGYLVDYAFADRMCMFCEVGGFSLVPSEISLTLIRSAAES